MSISEPPVQTSPDLATDRTVCAVHPTVETTLRCNKCGRYMCTRCAVRTPVGYRCRECVYQQQDAFFTATNTDFMVAMAVSFAIGFAAGFILSQMLFLAAIFSLPAGALIGEVVVRANGRRRGRNTWVAVSIGIVVAVVIAVGASLALNIGPFQGVLEAISSPHRIGGGGGVMGDVLAAMLSPLVYVVLCLIAAVARVRYGK